MDTMINTSSNSYNSNFSVQYNMHKQHNTTGSSTPKIEDIFTEGTGYNQYLYTRYTDSAGNHHYIGNPYSNGTGYVHHNMNNPPNYVADPTVLKTTASKTLMVYPYCANKKGIFYTNYSTKYHDQYNKIYIPSESFNIDIHGHDKLLDFLSKYSYNHICVYSYEDDFITLILINCGTHSILVLDFGTKDGKLKTAENILSCLLNKSQGKNLSNVSSLTYLSKLNLLSYELNVGLLQETLTINNSKTTTVPVLDFFIHRSIFTVETNLATKIFNTLSGDPDFITNSLLYFKYKDDLHHKEVQNLKAAIDRQAQSLGHTLISNKDVTNIYTTKISSGATWNTPTSTDGVIYRDNTAEFSGVVVQNLKKNVFFFGTKPSNE